MNYLLAHNSIACEDRAYTTHAFDWRRPVLGAYFVILLTFGGGAGWAALAKLDSAAIAQGIVTAQSNRKSVQHLEGGIVREIAVRDGDQVVEGQALFRLDETQAQANLDTARNQLAAARIQEARLQAERDGLQTFEIPRDIWERSKILTVSKAIEDQRANQIQRAGFLKSQVDVLQARLQQTIQEVAGLTKDAESARQQLATIDLELTGLRQLLAKQLVPLSRVAALERERIRLNGVWDRASSDIEKMKKSADETRLSIVQTGQQFKQQIYSDLIDVRKNISDLVEREKVAEDVLNRLTVKAPRSGVVQALRVFTLGAVIKPGETFLEIAPTDDKLTVTLQISPVDIDSVVEGLSAQVRFPSYHSRRVPFMSGKVRSVSYDRVTDQQNPQNTYFQGEVIVDQASVPQELKDKLKPGMPVDVIVTTGEQTPLDYFLGPLFDRIGHGMREK